MRMTTEGPGTCQLCGAAMWFEAVLPTEDWKRIAGPDWNGYFCLACMDRRAEALGIHTTAEIYFSLQAIMSASYRNLHPLEDAITLTLEYPPSVNRYWRTHVVNGRPIIYLTDEARAYKETVGWKARIASPQLLQGPVGVRIDLYRPRAQGDVDNVLKVILDSCNQTLWKDDKQVKHLEIDVYDDKANPRVELSVWQR